MIDPYPLSLDEGHAWCLWEKVYDRDAGGNPVNGEDPMVKALSLDLIVALFDLRAMKSTTVRLDKFAAWYLVQRLRSISPDPLERELLVFLQDAMLYFYPELVLADLSQLEVTEDGNDLTYPNPNACENPRPDEDSRPPTGTI